MKKEVIWGIVIILVILSLGFWAKNNRIESSKTLKIGGAALNIEVADTDAEKVMGLSGKEDLGEDNGMLFIFDEEGYYGIWMKNMNFPIDIAWLDKDKKIVHIENGVLPETFPKVFYPQSPSLFVLEARSGFLEASKIKIGDLAEF